MTDIKTEPRNYFYVWNKRGKIPWFKHESLESAQTEAQRLASLKPGSKFYVLHCCEVVTVEVDDG